MDRQTAIREYQQLDGLNTVLPIGVRKIDTFRTLTTESLAVFMPFKVQEIQDKGGIYYGENAVSHNLIMVNKANLMNQSSILLGVPGSGKSFSAKQLMMFLMLNTDPAQPPTPSIEPQRLPVLRRSPGVKTSRPSSVTKKENAHSGGSGRFGRRSSRSRLSNRRHDLPGSRRSKRRTPCGSP